MNTEFSKKINGRQVRQYVLKNSLDTEVVLTNYGARVVSLHTKDKNGSSTNVVVGFDTIDAYLDTTEVYHGAVIGRFANRIAKGRFLLEGKEHLLEINNGPNHLHGGTHGFHSQVWDTESADEQQVSLLYESKEEEGYPGNLEVKVRYKLTEENELKINYEVVTDAVTIVNLTNHSYFNLNGIGSGSILDHQLLIDAEKYTPIDKTLIPFGHQENVAGSPFDFRTGKPIGQHIGDAHEQLANGNGYDHNFALNKPMEDAMALAATATGDKTGITLNVFTDQPGLQFYTGNFMNGANQIQGGFTDDFRTAFCLETQHFPDSPNQPSFPSTVLRPGETFRSATVYKFSIVL
jgi:aldose 1-epimerase